MSPRPDAPPLAHRIRLTLPQRQSLTPEELAHRRLRRRLLRYILDAHRHRESVRGLGPGERLLPAEA